MDEPDTLLPQPEQPGDKYERLLDFAITDDDLIGRESYHYYKYKEQGMDLQRAYIHSCMDIAANGHPRELAYYQLQITEIDLGTSKSRKFWVLTQSSNKISRRNLRLGCAAIDDKTASIIKFHALKLSVAVQSEEFGNALTKSGKEGWKIIIRYANSVRTDLIKLFPHRKHEIQISFSVSFSQMLTLMGYQRYKIRVIRKKDVERAASGTAVLDSLMLDATFLFAKLANTEEDALVQYRNLRVLAATLPPSRKNILCLEKTNEQIANILEKRGDLGMAAHHYDQSLELFINYSKYYRGNSEPHDLLKRTYHLSELWSALGRNDRAAKILYRTGSHLQGHYCEALKPHIRLLKLRYDLFWKPADRLQLYLDYYIDDFSFSALEAGSNIRNSFVKRWIDSIRVGECISDPLTFTKKTLEVFDLARHYELNPFEGIVAKLREERDSAGISTLRWKAYSDFYATEISRVKPAFHSREGNISVTLFNFGVKSKSIEKNLPKIQTLLNNAMIDIRNSAMKRQPMTEGIGSLSSALESCDGHIPTEVFSILELFIRNLASDDQPLDSGAAYNLVLLLEKLELSAVNYVNPDEQYLIWTKIENIYNDLCFTLVRRSRSINNLHVSSSMYLDLLSILADRSETVYDQRQLTSNDFSVNNINIREVTNILLISDELKQLKLKYYLFVDGFDSSDSTTKCPPSPSRFGKKTANGVPMPALNREKIFESLVAANIRYEDALLTARAKFPGISAFSKRRKRVLGDHPPSGTVWIHLISIKGELLCILYNNYEILNRQFGILHSDSIRDILTEKFDVNRLEYCYSLVANILNIVTGELNWSSINLIKVCFSNILEAISWDSLMPYLVEPLRKIPFVTVISVGDSDDHFALPCGNKDIVFVTPCAGRTDIPFSVLEGRSLFVKHKNSKIFSLSETSFNFIEEIKRAGIIHVTGHLAQNAQSPADSAIVSAATDTRGLSLSLFYANIASFNGALVLLNTCQSARRGSDYERDITQRLTLEMRSDNRRATERKALASALLSCQSSSVVTTLWDVDDLSSFLFGSTFIEILTRMPRPLRVSDVVKDAASWLKTLRRDEAILIVRRELANTEVKFDPDVEKYIHETIERLKLGPEVPFANPYYWSGYIAYGRSKW